MRALLQRVAKAKVRIGEKVIAEIGPGLVVFLGVGKQDNEVICQKLAVKIARLRIWDDARGKMNHSLLETGGSVLVVSQVTLYADTDQGLRPSFSSACEPKRAEQLYEHFVAELRYLGITVKTGRFGEYMDVELMNRGPVTILMEE